MTAFDPPLRPRSGVSLTVLIIARISTVHQDLRSLADQIALCEKYVRDRYPGPARFVHIQGRGSGEYLDRRELAEAEAAVESRGYDLVVVEDIGRICRRNRAVDFCELCEDADTRLVAINDGIDTADEGWRLRAFFASFKHESGNKDTSKRIRRTLRNRFEQGGVIQTFPFGYVKPPGAKADATSARTRTPSRSTTSGSTGSRRGRAIARSPTGSTAGRCRPAGGRGATGGPGGWWPGSPTTRS